MSRMLGRLEVSFVNIALFGGQVTNLFRLPARFMRRMGPSLGRGQSLGFAASRRPEVTFLAGAGFAYAAARSFRVAASSREEMRLTRRIEGRESLR